MSLLEQASDLVLKGGEFVAANTPSDSVFIPEELSEEQEMVRQSVKDFAQTHIYPNRKKIEKQENNIARDLLGIAGELGFLGAHIPENYGGMGLDTPSNTILVEEVGATQSFSVAFAAHTGIGMLPLLYYGSEEQKQKYLPKAAAGQISISYCLTEPGSGSDALAAKTKAVLSPDGKHYLLTGQKMWITNAGFADLFIVFAKIDGLHFTCFLVERGAEGLSFGAEEDKMGIKGSSTRQVFFENTPVPLENILGEVGKGHLIAFNVLNIGRYKLGALALGNAKRNIGMGVRYANERQQFKQAIANFGAIQYKIAEQVSRTYALESAIYRSAALLEQRIKTLENEGLDHAQAQLQAAEDYAIECALLKVLGSEVLDLVVDETVQIHGGNGFSEEYGAAADYRDSRINRIFEGTNEINRLLMVSMLLKRGLKGEFELRTAIEKAIAELQKGGAKDLGTETFGAEKTALQNAKYAFLAVLGTAVQYEAQKILNLKDAQEVCSALANAMIEIFVLESLLLRVEKLESRGELQSNHLALLQLNCYEGLRRLGANLEDATLSFAIGEEQTLLLKVIKPRYARPLNPTALRREIAQAAIKANDYAI